MAFQIAELFATIRADDAQIQGALPRIESKLRKTQLAMRGVSRVARRMFLAVAAVIALTVKQASDAEEAHSKFITVFRDEGIAMTKWALTQGKALGRATIDMERFLGTIQDTLVPLGIARKEATVLSKSIVLLGLDLASFNNEADITAISNLQSALVGQSRAVLKYGVVINQAAIKQELLNTGLATSFEAATNQQKVQARLNIIFRSTTDAQGDLIRTQGSFENQSKALVSAIKDMNAQLGQVFIPTLIRAMRAIRSILPAITRWVTQNKTLAFNIAAVTLAVLSFLAVAPLLLGTLSLIAAHPVVATLILIATGLAAITGKMILARIEARGLAEDLALMKPPGGELTLDVINSRLGVLRKRRKIRAGEVEEEKKLAKAAEKRDLERGGPGGTPIESLFGVSGLLAAKDALANLDAQIVILEKRQKSLAETTETTARAVAKAEKEIAEDTERELTIAEMKRLRADQEARSQSRLDARELAQELLLDEVSEMQDRAKELERIEQERADIVAFWAEQRDKINKAFDDKELRDKEIQLARLGVLFAKARADRKALEAKAATIAEGRVGAIRTTGFAGFEQFGRRLQESILRKSEGDRRDRLLKEQKNIALKQLAEQIQTNTLLGPAGDLFRALQGTLSMGF